MQLKPGARLRSQVCTTEVIVIRPPAGDVDLRCGGEPMVDVGAEISGNGLSAVRLSAGTLLGKRYTTAANGFELLATKAGAGTLSVGDEPLVLQAPKQLPPTD